MLINVIVGGTGRYEGARGLMIGTAEGGGEGKVCGKWPDGSDLELPETIMKDLSGTYRRQLRVISDQDQVHSRHTGLQKRIKQMALYMILILTAQQLYYCSMQKMLI